MEKLISQFKALPAWQRVFLVAIFPIFLNLYIYFMLLSPQLEEREKIKGDIEIAKDQLAKARESLNPAIIQNLRKEEERLKKEYLEKEMELTSLVGEIPKEREVGKVLKNIGSIAKKNNLIVLNMQISNPEKVNYYMDSQKQIVKILKQEAPQQQQQPPQPQEGVPMLKADAKLTLLGSYTSLRSFLESLGREGIISYPIQLNLSTEGSKLRAELTLHLLFKEEVKQ